ncbi:MAG: metallophosphoesterase [Corallococcus sp.]|nr:metallophosphoesterase [Corallococcus sp.]MCM1359923.1 metallophosphoesterase [Corallococcus sp.]
MKIVHTADIHLDSPLSGVADSRLRRAELLRALSDMAKYADNCGAGAVIVAGDLFDDKFASLQTVTSVAKIISASKARWFVLRGNHGDETPYIQLKKQCAKVNFFGEDWTSYDVGDAVITGRELGTNDAAHWQQLSLNKNRFNVLTLHGDLDDASYGVIDKKAIADSGADYVALGHRHAFCEHKFGRTVGCYSGVLEARGFDELAPAGFVVLDTDTGKFNFVSHPIRRVETLNIDVSRVTTEFDLENLIDDAVANVSTDNYLNAVFCGALADGIRLEAVAETKLKNRFFALRVQNRTVPQYDLQKLSEEISLRGEFVKLALSISDEAERNEVLRLGLLALSGEELA